MGISDSSDFLTPLDSFISIDLAFLAAATAFSNFSAFEDECEECLDLWVASICSS